jgi:hypothetical protein
MRAELDLIEAGFDKLPGLTGNANKAVVVNGSATALGVTTGTLTLSGNFNVAGGQPLTFTLTGSTSLTLPTSGTIPTDSSTTTFTNKSVNLLNNTLTGTLAQFNTALSDGDFASLAGTEVLTNKTVNLASNTITGTLAQFNTALSDADFATLAGSESLSNKTLPSPTFSGTAGGSLTSLALTSAILTTSTVAADPSAALGIASKQYVDAQLTLGAPIATTSGTAHDFTGFPATTKRITGSLTSVSTSGTSSLIIQLGDSGGIETTGYSSGNAAVSTTSNSENATTGLLITSVTPPGTSSFHGSFVLTLVSSTTNTWAFSSNFGRSDSAIIYVGGGSKALTTALTQIRLTTVGGTDTFDAGTFNVVYES